MTSKRRQNTEAPADRDLSRSFNSLYQVVYELEGLKRLEDVVPKELLWDRPPGLPSGAELLWLVHLIDAHVFLPAAADIGSSDLGSSQPDYPDLLAAYPCTPETLDALIAEITVSRQELVESLETLASDSAKRGAAAELIDTVLAHDRRLLSALTERLYESGLGA